MISGSSWLTRFPEIMFAIVPAFFSEDTNIKKSFGIINNNVEQYNMLRICISQKSNCSWSSESLNDRR
jgi:hypothetical protein